MNTKEELKGFKTACYSCIFAQKNKTSQQQYECELGRLKKFQQQNRAVWDADHNAYIINGICNTCRGNIWKQNNTSTDPISTVLREIEIKVDFVLYSINDMCDNIKWKLERAVNSIVKQQKIKPQKIVVVIQNDKVQFTPLYNTIQELTKPFDIPFQLVRVIESDADLDRCVEMGIDKCNNQYTAVFDIEYMIPINIIERLNTILNDDLTQFVLIEPIKEYNGLILSTKLFSMFGKNYNFPIFEKIKEIAHEQDKNDLIFTWEKLWNREPLL